ncbi:MAG: hypothetical protein MRY32_02080 [Rickettsiales bacterium]|nr:hypothetical protein [Rickettsiales bacterium]
MLNLYPFDDSGDVILKRILCCVILFGLLKLCFNFAFFDRYIAIGDGYILSPNFFDGTRISLQNSSGDTLIDGMVGYYTHASDTLHGEIGDYLGHPYQYFYVDASMS